MTDDEIAKLCREWPNNATQAARAIIAAYTAKLLAGVEMPEPHTYTFEGKSELPTMLYTADQLQQYAAAAAAQARMKALDEALEVAIDACGFNGATVQIEAHIRQAIEKLKGGE